MTRVTSALMLMAFMALATGISARDLLTNECTKDKQCVDKLGYGATCKDCMCVPPPECTKDKQCVEKLGYGATCKDYMCVPPPECTKDKQCEAKLGKGATCKDQKCVAPPPPPPATGDKATQACKQYVTSTQTANPVQAGNNANGGAGGAGGAGGNDGGAGGIGGDGGDGGKILQRIDQTSDNTANCILVDVKTGDITVQPVSWPRA